MKKLILSLFLLVYIAASAMAQDRTITGTVTGKDDGIPIPGVSVRIKGGQGGGQTDARGKYSIKVNSTARTLDFSSIGYLSQSVNITGSNVINVSLSSDSKTLGEVVVTALGISRNKKSLGYATQQVSGADLTKTNEPNVINSLSGKVAGVQVTGSGGAVGSSARIVLRGNNSFGNNQPLFVIDGVPLDNTVPDLTSAKTGTTDYGTGIQDIDPNNIQSVNVLKGANAAALYGSRAANGVIMITTKSGAGTKGLGITYSAGFSFEQVYLLPRYQNKYGQGTGGSEYEWKAAGSPGTYNQFARENGYNYVDGAGAGVNDGDDESWGPRLDAGLLIPQYNSPIGADGLPTPTPWISHPNNTKSFFQTGYTLDNNIALTTSGDKGSTRFSYTNQKQVGTIPNTDQMKNTFQLNTTQNITSKFKVDAMLNYVRIDNKNLAGQGYNEFNPMQSIGSWFGRQVDMADLKAHQNELLPNGNPYNWISTFHDNPYSIVNSIYNQSRQKDRLFGYISASYKFDNWLNAMIRVGDDISYENRKETVSNKEIAIWATKGGGNFTQYEYYRNELNVDFLLTGSGQIAKDVSLSYTAGANHRDSRLKYTMIKAADLVVPGIYNISNVNGNPAADNSFNKLQSNSLFGQASFGYKNWLYADFTARNDWSSTLPSQNRSYFYPSVSLSWVFTEALKIDKSILNYGKLRTSWAQVGNATSAYQTIGIYNASANAFNGVTQYSISSQLPPLNLKPEKIVSKEIGLELGAFDNRLRLDATYYNKVTTNQIMGIALSSFTGASTLLINAGEIQNKGVEIQLGGTIIKQENGFQWDIDINWAKNKNRVNKLYTDPVTGQTLSSYPISTAWGMNINAVPGQEFGVIKGSAYHRNDKGEIVVNSKGLLTYDSQQTLGNITPDWVGGITNTFKYRAFSLSFLVDFRKGGDFFSTTKMFGATTGVLDFTAQGNFRENGVVIGRDVLQGYKVVKADGTPNDKVISAQSFFTNVSYAGGGTEYDIVDGSYIKLRTINLSYALPKSITNKISWLKGASIGVFANNVALLHTDKSNTAHIDPETGFGADNTGLGIEQYQIPSSRSIGLKLNLSL
ncbi:SusC/RagA family TonB-linked outer membrane protein [Pedobacter cryoconitis]|uniref:TonB-linked SusC/RagA family outer membrane protein n=1 Tax=Pedobacter cryoconitis TaxID=188932 RepID=A0A7X0MKS2_9SPHI|nr:SusC/RagA family TonB-linked outer membrane protein [Pedobacter cryoconitis]MBB6500748.1 TonB-linked SusC/RagA family outer membrane protein [Pedobacter cryoconitis]